MQTDQRPELFERLSAIGDHIDNERNTVAWPIATSVGRFPPKRSRVPLVAATVITIVGLAGIILLPSHDPAPSAANEPTPGIADVAEPSATSPTSASAQVVLADSVTAATLFSLDVEGWQLAQLLVEDGGMLATYMQLDEMTDESGGPVVTVTTGTGSLLDPVVTADWDRLEQLSEVEVLGAGHEMRSGISGTVHAVRWQTTGGVDVAVSAADVTAAEAADLMRALRPLTPEDASQVLASRNPDRTPTSTIPG